MISKGGLNNFVSLLSGPSREGLIKLRITGDRHQIYFEDIQARRRLGMSIAVNDVLYGITV